MTRKIRPTPLPGHPRPHDRERQAEHEEPDAADAAEEVVVERAIGTEREQHQPRRGGDQDQDERGTHGAFSCARGCRSNGAYTDCG